MKDFAALDQKVKEFNEIDLETLKRSNLGQFFSFEEVYPQIEASYNELKHLSSKRGVLESSPYVSQNDLNHLKDRIERFNRIAKQITEFDPTTGGDPNPRKQGIVNEVSALTNEIASHLQSLAVLIRSVEFDPTQQTAELRKKEEQVAALLEQLNKSREEADVALQGIKDSSAVSGAKEFSKVFGGQAGIHKLESVKWFWTSVAMFVLLLAYLGWLLFFAVSLTENASTAFVIREGILRVLILGALSYALSQTVRNFNTNKHLQVVNEHRQNSLDTFELFVNAGSTEEVKSAVLMQATKSVFETGQTGHLTKSNSTSYSLNVTDVFKRLGSSE
jgi:hypothetical protein